MVARRPLRTHAARHSGRGAFARGATLALGLIAALAPASGAAVPGGAHATVSDLTYSDGCATSHLDRPVWTARVARFTTDERSASRSCGPARGGPATQSVQGVWAQVNVLEPVAFVSGPGGVNVSWTVQLHASDAAPALGAASCPASWRNSTTDFGPAWLNETELVWNCYSDASVEVYAEAGVNDLTNGSGFPTVPAWTEWTNQSGASVGGLEVWGNYSSRLYSNFTSYSFTATSWGSHGALPSTIRVVIPVNGTFVAGHHYEMWTILGFGVSTQERSFPAARASAVLDVGGSVNGATLGTLHPW